MNEGNQYYSEDVQTKVVPSFMVIDNNQEIVETCCHVDHE